MPPVPDMPFEDYFELIERRFSNPKIGDTIQRLCLDGSNRQPKFILPTIADRLKAGKSVTGLALVSALWCRYCSGTTDTGKPTNYLDASAERLKVEALKAKDDPKAFLAMTDIFGEVGTSPIFAESFSRILRTLWDKGARETLRLYLDDKL